MTNNDHRESPPDFMPVLNLTPPTTAVPRAFYEQIMDGIKAEIQAGRLPAHTPLPSFRALANQLLVSTITVKRAYEELEREGLIYLRERMGTFVSENSSTRNQEIHRQKTEALLKEAVEAARNAGMTREEVIQKLNQLMQEKQL